MSHRPAVVSAHETEQGNARSYIWGFVLSLILTLAAFDLAMSHWLSGALLYGSLGSLAILQLWVQLYFFMHLGNDPRPRWNRLVFSFMLLTVGLLVIGSIWIMTNLNYNMMPVPSDQQLIRDEINR